MFNIYTESFYWSAFTIFLWMPFVVFFCLNILKIRAPYGRFTSNIWGASSIPARLGWILMESPSSLIFLAYFVVFVVSGTLTLMQAVFFIIWQFHYAYRSFIYPNLARLSKPMPISTMLASFSFQMFNTFFQVRWIFDYAPEAFYPNNYWQSPFFIVGLILFLGGSFLNRWADNVLRSLRPHGETEYKIPYGGAYKWISCPNYLGEMILWLGWAVMLRHWVGFAFFFWTVANLAPRALSIHAWYQEKFPNEYPVERKALLPFII
ncbi:MAG: 3-oxo-5-alpha-steroid 4-dehydrogenase [Brevinema sp.]